MIAPGNFLCGCNPADKVGFGYDVHPQTGAPIPRKDSEGFLVCPEHGERMYGWRSPLISTPIGDRIDFSRLGSSDGSKLKLDFSGEDLRFNDDPTEYYFFVRDVDEVPLPKVRN